MKSFTDFVHAGDGWEVGQHFYVCLPEISIWQSYPFTPCSLPGTKAEGLAYSYIMRAKKEATRALAGLAAAKADVNADGKMGLDAATSALLDLMVVQS